MLQELTCAATELFQQHFEAVAIQLLLVGPQQSDRMGVVEYLHDLRQQFVGDAPGSFGPLVGAHRDDARERITEELPDILDRVVQTPSLRRRRPSPVVGWGPSSGGGSRSTWVSTPMMGGGFSCRCEA